jgi:hypothetical protein
MCPPAKPLYNGKNKKSVPDILKTLLHIQEDLLSDLCLDDAGETS